MLSEVNLSTPRPKGRGFQRFIPSTLLRAGSEPRFHPTLKGGASRGRTGEPAEGPWLNDDMFFREDRNHRDASLPDIFTGLYEVG